MSSLLAAVDVARGSLDCSLVPTLFLGNELTSRCAAWQACYIVYMCMLGESRYERRGD